MSPRLNKIWLSGLVLVFASCVTPEQAKVREKAALLQKLVDHPSRKIGHWSSLMAKPFEERILPAPAEMLELLHLDNEYQDWPDRPEAFVPNEALLRDLETAVHSMPPFVREILAKKTVAIFLVKNLGGSAYTNFVSDEAGQRNYGVIALDATVLDRRANAWASFKESSPYRTNKNLKIEAKIEESANDDRVSAFRYILLHEIGHVVAIGRPEVPPFDGPIPKADYKFSDISWSVLDSETKTRFDQNVLFEREKIHYYATPERQLPFAHAYEDYRALTQTDFPSLYAVTNPWDDFAESFVTYVHAELMKKPWRVRLEEEGRVVFELRPCWHEPRCQAKKSALLEVLRAEARRLKVATKF